MNIKEYKKFKKQGKFKPKKLNRYGMDNKPKKSSVPELQQYSFRSQLEIDHAVWLLSEQQAGRIIKFEYEKRYRLEVNNKKICDIIPDFTVYLPDGRIQIHEIKANITKTNEWRIKSNLFRALCPDLEYLVNPRKII